MDGNSPGGDGLHREDSTLDHFVVVVEGKNDRARVRRILPESVRILTTNGIPNSETIYRLQKSVGNDDTTIILTDADASGKRIRGMLREIFPDALHIYIRSSFDGVEHTPIEYLESRFRRLGILPEETSEFNGFGLMGPKGSLAKSSWKTKWGKS